MLRTYIIDTRQFERLSSFQKAFESVSPYRRQRIILLKQQKDKIRSLGAAVALNAALRTYGLEERMMEYELGQHGKPYFRDYPELHFSLSHSGDYALCTMGPQVNGNDIERVRGGRERVAQRFFAKEEAAWIEEAALPEEREERLFRIWTMKESFLKVTGLGMSLPLQDFAVITEDGTGHVRHNINNISYFIKEYTLPTVLAETEKYQISVCCEALDFAAVLEPVFFRD